MNGTDAAISLRGKGERRFFLQPSPPKLIIVDTDVETNPNHYQIATRLVAIGLLGAVDNLLAGYCMERKGTLRYWGGTAGSLPSASEAQFNAAVQSVDIAIVT